MAQGRSNAAIAQRLFITERAVAKHTASIFCKLDLPRPRTTTVASAPTSAASAPGAPAGWTQATGRNHQTPAVLQ